ncbi:MAG: response regulator, partial [Marinilabiliales bacterium]|nr:response regulator [Marinilabiliales bacterium]
ELFDSKEQAEAGNRLKTALLNNMSHEIRTPMNAIMGFSELMRNADAEDKLTYSEIIFKCSIDLLNVIDQVMLLSRLQSEKIPQEKSRFPVLNMLQQCSSGFREEARSKGLQWEMVVPPKANTLELYTDEEKVREILICLFSNALKYTQKGFVRVECSKQADAILFSVSDSGMGIQEKERERIFEPFYRGENAISQAIRGVGVGLNIAAILAQLIGAKLSFETEMGKGSRFELSVPLALPKKETVTPPAHRMSDHSLSKLKVLIAEDEHLSYQYLIHLLKGQVQQLDRAQNGQEVLEMVEKSHYDLVLMDIQMPVMDGLEATRQLKRKNPNLLVIAQSAFILPSEQGQAMEAGCDGFVAKPIQKEQLMEMIHRFI